MLKKLFKKNLLFYIILFSLFVHIVAAYFSEGFYRHDEHFSILEPINYKLGKTATITFDFFEVFNRSWFLTSVYYFISKILSFFYISSPFKIAFVYRLLSSLLGWLSIICLIFLSKKILINKYSFYISALCATLLWFYPFLHARTSSENIGSSLLIIGITIFICLKKNKFNKLFFLISGLIFGLVFLTRFTIGPAILGFGLWALFINRNRFYELFLTVSGIIIIILVGVLIDYWGYNQILFSALNYYNFQTDNVQLSHLPAIPWWYYFYLISNFFPPLGFIILISMLFFWIKLSKSFVTWTTLTLFIFLSLVNHKELRYVFPILVFTPIFIGGLVDNLQINKKNIISIFLGSYLFKSFIILIVAINFLALSILSLIPAYSSMGLFKFLYKNPYKIENLYTLDSIPYIKTGLLINFYRNSEINFIKIMDLEECPKEIIDKLQIPITLDKNYSTNKIFNSNELNWKNSGLPYLGPQFNLGSSSKQLFDGDKYFIYEIICNKFTFNNYIKNQKNIFVLFSENQYLDFYNRKDNLNCKLIYYSLPRWFYKFNYTDWLGRIKKWHLFNCQYKQ